MSDLGVEVLIYTPPGSDPGSVDYDPVAVAPRRLEGCQVYPRMATEESGRSSTTIIGYTALIPMGPDLDSAGTLTWRGKVFLIEGEAGEWRFLDGGDACLQVAMHRKRG